ncbi:hypothetical protein SEVIR_7G222100v4 [Setaria viridis]|nr:uncharacterized protein LOC101763053 [Setaria italica]
MTDDRQLAAPAIEVLIQSMYHQTSLQIAVYKETPAASETSNPTKQQRRSTAQASSLIDRSAPATATTMTPASIDPCSDHSYELPLRRNLLLLLDLLGLLRFVAAVLLDRLGVVSCEGGGVQLPGRTWGRGGVRADYDDAAVERFIEAMLWAPRSPVTGTTRARTAALYRRRRRVAQPADDKDGGEGAAVCAICLAGLGAGGCETVVELGVCSHAFHAACIDAWAGTGEAATCPLCRAPMSLPTAWDDGRQGSCHASSPR